MSFYKTDQAQTLGAGQLVPAGSLTDIELADRLLSYRRVVAGGYKSITPEEVEGRLPPGSMQVSRKLDGQMWFLIVDGDEVVLSNPPEVAAQRLPGTATVPNVPVGAPVAEDCIRRGIPVSRVRPGYPQGK